MGGYLPNTAAERAEMCAAIGIQSADELYSGVPDSARLAGGLSLPEGMGEMRVLAEMRKMAAKNPAYRAIFRGAGAERHYIPAIVNSVTSREEFVTAYTPYQPEISQGVLQSIFEYQSMVCDLYGMDAANASVYDAASAMGEAAQMCRERARVRVLISGAVNPRYAQAVRTYAAGRPVDEIPAPDGRTDLGALAAMLTPDTACVMVQQPNYFGLIEDLTALSGAAHAAGAKLVVCFHPLAASIYKTPGECGADVCVGEGQPLGLPLGYGGPYLGLMACKAAMMRRLPGRIVGQTTDKNGARAFVLTLQAREQHIRRERASSSLCSNQALCAMRASVYMAAMGADGLREAASQSRSKAHYLARALADAGYPRIHKGEFFHEFVTACPANADALLARLAGAGILGGLRVDGGILWCATEMNAREEMDEVARIAREALS